MAIFFLFLVKSFEGRLVTRNHLNAYISKLLIVIYCISDVCSAWLVDQSKLVLEVVYQKTSYSLCFINKWHHMQGDILFLHMSKDPIRTGEIVVFNIDVSATLVSFYFYQIYIYIPPSIFFSIILFSFLTLVLTIQCRLPPFCQLTNVITFFLFLFISSYCHGKFSDESVMSYVVCLAYDHLYLFNITLAMSCSSNCHFD